MKLDKNGSLLVESLFGFLVYINIICVFISLITTTLASEKRLELYINKLDRMEELPLNLKDLNQIIEMVLH